MRDNKDLALVIASYIGEKSECVELCTMVPNHQAQRKFKFGITVKLMSTRILSPSEF